MHGVSRKRKRRFRCETCGQTFYRRSDLDAHVRAFVGQGLKHGQNSAKLKIPSASPTVDDESDKELEANFAPKSRKTYGQRRLVEPLLPKIEVEEVKVKIEPELLEETSFMATEALEEEVSAMLEIKEEFDPLAL